jgi:hypothetical protein
MKKLRFPGICLLLIMIALMASSCASSKPGYHPEKAKKPKHCDCSEWGYNFNLEIFHLQENEEGPSGWA